MRVATKEEDFFLQEISKLQNANYILLNEIMLCESQIKGYKEQRRKETTKFITDICICVFLCLFTFICIKAGGSNMYTGAIFTAACGVAIVIPVFCIYTVFVSIRYYAKISSHELALLLSRKLKVDNIYQGEISNQSTIIKYKNEIESNKSKLEEITSQYNDLKNQNDELFEKELKSGKRKADFNFEAYNNFIDISNERINYNKKRVEYTSSYNKKRTLEDNLEKMYENEEQCKKSVKLFSLLLFMLILTIFILFWVIRFNSDRIIVYYSSLFLVLIEIATGISLVINFVNLTINLPFLIDTKLSAFIADKIGLDNTKRDRKNMMEELSNTEKRLQSTEEEMMLLKKVIDDYS